MALPFILGEYRPIALAPSSLSHHRRAIFPRRPCMRPAPRAATGHRVRARCSCSRPIADGDGGAAARRRPAHGVLVGDRRRPRDHDPCAVLIDRRAGHALRRGVLAGERLVAGERASPTPVVPPCPTIQEVSPSLPVKAPARHRARPSRVTPPAIPADRPGATGGPGSSPAPGRILAPRAGPTSPRPPPPPP